MERSRTATRLRLTGRLRLLLLFAIFLPPLLLNLVAFFHLFGFELGSREVREG